MAGLSVRKGDSISIDKQVYTCLGSGPGGRYALDSHKGDSRQYLYPEKLLDLYQEGRVQILDTVHDHHTQALTITDLTSIPEVQQVDVMMREYYVQALHRYRLEGGTFSPKPMKCFTLEIFEKYKKYCKENNITPPEKPMAESTLRRWYRTWRDSGFNVLSLIRTPSGNRHSKLNWEQNHWIDTIIKEEYLTKSRRTAASCYQTLVSKMDFDNRQRVENGRAELRIPSYKTFCLRIQDLDEYKKLSARYSPEYAYIQTRYQRSTPEFHRHLECVQADHTMVDIYVDLGLGVLQRPHLTTVVDCYTGSLLGFWVSADPPSSESVMNALCHAALPKDVLGMGGKPEWRWPMFGIPEMLILDNGADFRGKDLRTAALGLNIDLAFAPPRQAFYKSQIERLFGEVNDRLLQKLPAKVHKYEPENHGLDYPHLSLDEFTSIFVQWVTTILHRDAENDFAHPPEVLWQNSIQKHGFSGSGLEQEYVRLTLSKSGKKQHVLHPNGIYFNSLVFNNKFLNRYRNAIISKYNKGNPKAELKWSAADVGVIWVFDEMNRTYFPVEAKNEYAHGRSFFNHKVIIREKNNRKKSYRTDTSYRDAFLALDDTIKKSVKSKKTPQNVHRFVRGRPAQTDPAPLGNENLEQEYRSSFSLQDSETSVNEEIHQNNPLNDQSDDHPAESQSGDPDEDIDDIPDEISF